MWPVLDSAVCVPVAMCGTGALQLMPGMCFCVQCGWRLGQLLALLNAVLWVESRMHCFFITGKQSRGPCRAGTNAFR